MKFSWLLFACYIIALSLLPCHDDNECNVISITEISQAQHHEDHDHEHELCTPFCHCACCGQQIACQAIFNYSPLVFKLITMQRNIMLYDQQFVSNYFASIWQPPQLT